MTKISVFLEAFYIIAIVAFGWLTITRIEWAIYVFFLLLPAYQIRFFVGIPITLLEVLLLIVVSGYFGVFNWRFWQYRLFNLYKYLIVGLLLAGGISVIVAPDLLAALGLYKAYIIEPILFFIVLGEVIKEPKQWLNILYAMTITAFVGGLWAGLQWYTGLFIPEAWRINETFRATGFYPYPNAMALFIAPIISAVAGYILLIKDSAAKLKIYASIVFILLLAILVSTQSVGGIIAVSAGITFSVFFALQKNTYRFVLLLILVLIFGFALQVPSIKQELLLEGPSGDTRQMIWDVSKNLVVENPFLGVGLHGFEPAFNEMRPEGYREAVLYPHNFVLNFWLELGLLGLASIMYSLVVFARYVWRHYLSNRILLVICAGMISMLVFGLVDVPFFKNDLALMWWLFLWIPAGGVAKDPML